VPNTQHSITEQDWQDAETIWEYHQMEHTLRPCSAAIGLGSHDLGVATYSAGLYRDQMFPVIVYTGATSKTTAARFPDGEAVHYRRHALELGVPDSAILVEPHARNTGQNIAFSRDLLTNAGIEVDSVLLISKPYMQRRAYATCRHLWPDVEVVCASEPLTFGVYAKSIGDERLVIDMLVGDLQRIVEYPKQGFAIAQDVPASVNDAFDRLLRRGFDSRLLS
jgi:uncharacterized SAM-binding protein YcdF (DUF218 family)